MPLIALNESQFEFYIRFQIFIPHLASRGCRPARGDNFLLSLYVAAHAKPLMQPLQEKWGGFLLYSEVRWTVMPHCKLKFFNFVSIFVCSILALELKLSSVGTYLETSDERTLVV